MDSEYDVIVAGAGIAGSLAAASAAKNGARTLLLDRNTSDEPGKKTNWGWVCGDAVAKAHIDLAKKELGISLSEPELDLKVDGILAISPDLKNRMMFDGEGYMLDRPKFGLKLRDFAVRCGAEYRPEHEVEGPLLEGQNVTGVFGRDERKEVYRIKAKVVVDALGVASTLRRRLPPNEFVDRDVSIDDIESTGRYIMGFKPGADDPNYYDPRYALIHLNQVLAPGGYGWVFPKRGNRVNIGLGIEKRSLEMRNERLGKKDTLHTLIDEYVRLNPVIKDTTPDNSHNNAKGYWSVPVRRQFDSLVYNGYIGAGDSMAMPNPISAGGIGPAMIAGMLSGQVAAKAVSNNSTGMESLWDYNVLFNQRYGNRTAALEVFRVYLQSLNNELINYGMAHFITKDEAMQITYGLTPELGMASTFSKVLHGLANINAFRNLIFVVSKMKRLNALYDNYPKSISGFEKWKELVAVEMREVKERFKVNPI
jgi:flavin-dependent dehydrogenase